MNINKVTSKDIWNQFPDKTTFQWLKSGIHSYNVLLKEEQQHIKRLQMMEKQGDQSHNNRKAKEKWNNQ